jgi:hypothetical protein
LNPKRKYCLFILLVTLSLTTFGQDYKATAKLDKNAILIGDQVDMSLNFTIPAGTQYVWPSIKDTILGYIQVIGRTKIDTTFTSDKKSLTLSQKLRLTSFDSGFYTIPPIRFFYRNLPDTTIRYVQSDLQSLTVHSVAVDTTQAIKPIKGIVKIKFSLLDYLGWIIAGLIFIAILTFGIFYYLKKRQGEPIFTLRPSVKYLPHEWALMELDKLRVKKSWQSVPHRVNRYSKKIHRRPVPAYGPRKYHR